MRVTTRTHAIAVAFYSLPFLAVLLFSVLFTWAGNLEMIIAGVALSPAVLYFFGLRWCRYVVGVIAAMSFVLCSMIPMIRGTEGRYFWLIWLPIWLVFGFAALVSFVPVRQDVAEPTNAKDVRPA
jgi:hypothetical protein